jgi:hypothetical protein
MNLSAAMIFAGLFFSGCDLFNAKLDEDVANKIDQAVWEANAPVLNVQVEEGGMGTASPRGRLPGIKQTIPFTLNYVAKTEYPFTGWQARLGADIIAVWTPDGATGTDMISFEPQNATGTETKVTIHFNPGEQSITLGPLGADLPEIDLEFNTANHGSFQQLPAHAKLGVPFTVSFDPYVGYYFVEWRVYRDAVQDDKLLTGDKVAFANQNERQTQITVNVDTGGKIIVLAYTDTSPVLLFQEPEVKRFSAFVLPSSPSGPLVLGDIIPNTYARFIFTKPMDPASFTDSTVLITEKSSSSTTENDSRNSWYERPVFSLDRTRVTFYRYPSRSDVPGRGYPINTDYSTIISVHPTYETTYTITLTGELRSEAGFPVGRDMALRYTVKGYGSGYEATNFDLIGGGGISATYFFITKSALDKSDPKSRFIAKDMQLNENNSISPLSEEKIYIIAAIGTDTAQPLRRILIGESDTEDSFDVFGAYCEPLGDDDPEKTRILDALRKKAAAEGATTASILKNAGYVFAYSPNVCYESGLPGQLAAGTKIQIKIGLRTWADDPDFAENPPDRGDTYEVSGEGMTYYIGGM